MPFATLFATATKWEDVSPKTLCWESRYVFVVCQRILFYFIGQDIYCCAFLQL